jgi:hypothetical protein
MVDINICIGLIDYTNGEICVTEHCDREKIETFVEKRAFYLSGYQNCEYIACKLRDTYLIFYYDGTRLHYVRMQSYAEGMCRGTIYLDTGRVEVDEYGHKCEH